MTLMYSFDFDGLWTIGVGSALPIVPLEQFAERQHLGRILLLLLPAVGADEGPGVGARRDDHPAPLDIGQSLLHSGEVSLGLLFVGDLEAFVQVPALKPELDVVDAGPAVAGKRGHGKGFRYEFGSATHVQHSSVDVP